MTVYVTGPLGSPEAAQRVREAASKVANVKPGVVACAIPQSSAEERFRAVLDCDEVVVLSGWEASVPTRQDLQVAVWVRRPIKEWTDDTTPNISGGQTPALRPLDHERVKAILDRGVQSPFEIGEG